MFQIPNQNLYGQPAGGPGNLFSHQPVGHSNLYSQHQQPLGQQQQLNQANSLNNLYNYPQNPMQQPLTSHFNQNNLASQQSGLQYRPPDQGSYTAHKSQNPQKYSQQFQQQSLPPQFRSNLGSIGANVLGLNQNNNFQNRIQSSQGRLNSQPSNTVAQAQQNNPNPTSITALKQQSQQNQQIINMLVNQFQSDKQRQEQEQREKLQRQLATLRNEHTEMEQQLLKGVTDSFQRREDEQRRKVEERYMIQQQMRYGQPANSFQTGPLNYGPQPGQQKGTGLSAQDITNLFTVQQNQQKKKPPPMAPIPQHLLPQQSNYQVSNDPVIQKLQKVQQLSPFKQKRAGKIVEEQKEVHENAEFLQNLFKEENKDIEDLGKEQADQSYQQLVKQYEADKEKFENVLATLDIPQVDENENPKDIQQQLIKNQEEEEKLEKEQKKKEIKNKYEQLIQQTKFKGVKKGSKRYWRAVTKSLMIMLRTLREVEKNKFNQRQYQVSDLTDALKLYNDVTKGWIIKSIRKPLFSIFVKPDNDFLFYKPSLSKDQKEQKLMQLKVRVRGILQAMNNAIDPSTMPLPLIQFLNQLSKPKTYVPDNFMTPFELNRIELDEYGALMELEKGQIMLLSSMYIIGKILVGKILLNPAKIGLNIDLSNSTMTKNFKLIGTFLYLIFKQYITQETKEFVQNQNEALNADVISDFLQDRQQFRELLKSPDEKEWFKEQRKLIAQIVMKLYILITKAEDLKALQESQQ